jgi:heme exporter protein A
MSSSISITGIGLRMVFNRRTVFDGVRFGVAAGQTLLVSGRNGAGKSTLLKILAGILTPSAGSVDISVPGSDGLFGRQSGFGLVSSYLSLYEEFSAEENLRYIARIRGGSFDRGYAHDLLRRVDLFARKGDPLRTYSSGMKQRAKYAAALYHRPPILLLDEPMSSLDTDGIAVVRELMAEQRRQGVVIVATNDLSDVDRYDERVDLDALR